MLLAIDVGNTNIVLGVFEKARLLEALPRVGIAFLNGEDPLVSAMADRPNLDVRLFGAA